MQAVLAGQVIAEAPESALITIEGNRYFPPSSVTPGVLEESPTPYTCPWKGVCQYYSVRVGDELLTDRAWAYPHPIPSSFERVGRDYSGYLAFAPDVELRA